MLKDYRSVDKFDGQEKNWKTFEFDFKMATKTVSPKVLEAMERSALESQTVTGAILEGADGVIYEGMKDRGNELFEILCGYTSGSAKIMSEIICLSEVGAHIPCVGRARLLDTAMQRLKSIRSQSRFCRWVMCTFA